MSDWHYGRIDSASALIVDGRLHVRVRGVQPAPEVEVMLAVYPHDRKSTPDVQLGLYWRHGPEQLPDAPTPFAVRAEVDVHGMRVRTVRVYHADSFRDVTARHASPCARLPLADPPG
jgi:hypothetical protein